MKVASYSCPKCEQTCRNSDKIGGKTLIIIIIIIIIIINTIMWFIV